MKKINIKIGDEVMAISGKDRGKSGKVTNVIRDNDRVVVEGINLQKKHQKPKTTNQKGQIIEKPMSIHISNVQLIDPKTKKPTRIGISRENNKRVRVTKKSGTPID